MPRTVLRPKKHNREHYIRKIVENLQAEYKTLGEDRIREHLEDVPDDMLKTLLQASPYRGLVWNMLTAKDKHERIEQIRKQLNDYNRSNINTAVRDFLSPESILEDRELREEIVRDLREGYLNQDSPFYQCSFDIKERLERELKRKKEEQEK